MRSSAHGENPPRTAPRSGRLRKVVVAVGLVTAACQPAVSAPLPPAAPTVEVTMTDYRFDLDTDIPAGRVVFRLVNAGEVTHRPALVPVPESVPPIDEQLRGDERVVTVPFAGVRAREPGQTGTFAVDLEPGVRYALICFARDPDGQSHALKGMATEFRPG